MQNVLLMLSISLPGNSRLLVVKFWGVKSYTWIFKCTGVSAPNLHKQQLYIAHVSGSLKEKQFVNFWK